MSGGLVTRIGAFPGQIMRKLKDREAEMDAGNALILNINSGEAPATESGTEQPVWESSEGQNRKVA